MERIYAAPINADYYAVFVGDKKLTLPLSESDAKKIADRYNGFAELEKANKALSLQNEVLSAAFANSSKKEKDLMSDKAELLKLVKMLLQVETHSGWGLFDCVNDDGENYQSAHLERILARMETIVKKHKL